MPPSLNRSHRLFFVLFILCLCFKYSPMHAMCVVVLSLLLLCSSSLLDCVFWQMCCNMWAIALDVHPQCTVLFSVTLFGSRVGWCSVVSALCVRLVLHPSPQPSVVHHPHFLGLWCVCCGMFRVCVPMCLLCAGRPGENELDDWFGQLLSEALWPLGFLVVVVVQSSDRCCLHVCSLFFVAYGFATFPGNVIWLDCFGTSTLHLDGDRATAVQTKAVSSKVCAMCPCLQIYLFLPPPHQQTDVAQPISE